MKTIYMTVKASCYNLEEDKPGNYTTIVSYHDHNGNRFSKKLEGKATKTTANRMIITGLIEGIRILKEPCLIKLRTHSTFGLAKIKKVMKNEKAKIKSVNKDLLIILMEELEQGKHGIEETIADIYI